jgi:hypothetical protein
VEAGSDAAGDTVRKQTTTAENSVIAKEYSIFVPKSAIALYDRTEQDG